MCSCRDNENTLGNLPNTVPGWVSPQYGVGSGYQGGIINFSFDTGGDGGGLLIEPQTTANPGTVHQPPLVPPTATQPQVNAAPAAPVDDPLGIGVDRKTLLIAGGVAALLLITK